MNNYYNTLEISPRASKEEIKKAFRRLAHLHHPDKQGGNEEKFKEISQAYTELMKLPDESPLSEALRNSHFSGMQYRANYASSNDIFSRFTQQNRQYDSMIRQNMIRNLEMRIQNAKTRRAIIDQEISSLEQEIKIIKDAE